MTQGGPFQPLLFCDSVCVFAVSIANKVILLA